MSMEDFEISVELAILITWRVLKTISARKLPPEILISFSGVSSGNQYFLKAPHLILICSRGRDPRVN